MFINIFFCGGNLKIFIWFRIHVRVEKSDPDPAFLCLTLIITILFVSYSMLYTNSGAVSVSVYLHYMITSILKMLKTLKK